MNQHHNTVPHGMNIFDGKSAAYNNPERIDLRSMVWVETRPTRTHGQQKEGAPRMKRRRTLALLRHRSLGAHGTAGRLRGLGNCLLRTHGPHGRTHSRTHSLRHLWGTDKGEESASSYSVESSSQYGCCQIFQSEVVCRIFVTREVQETLSGLS